MLETISDIDMNEKDTVKWYALPESVNGEIRGTFREIVASEAGQDKKNATDHNLTMKIEMTPVEDWKFHFTYTVFDSDVVIGKVKNETGFFLSGGRYFLDYDYVDIIKNCDFFKECFNSHGFEEVINDISPKDDRYVYWLNSDIKGNSLCADIIRATVDVLRNNGKAVYSVRFISGAMSDIYDHSEWEAIHGAVHVGSMFEFNCSLSIDTGIERLWVNVTGCADDKVWSWPHVLEDNDPKYKVAKTKINDLITEWLLENRTKFYESEKICSDTTPDPNPEPHQISENSEEYKSVDLGLLFDEIFADAERERMNYEIACKDLVESSTIDTFKTLAEKNGITMNYMLKKLMITYHRSYQ